jgi:hypothetical protein
LCRLYLAPLQQDQLVKLTEEGVSLISDPGQCTSIAETSPKAPILLAHTLILDTPAERLLFNTVLDHLLLLLRASHIAIMLGTLLFSRMQS